MGGPLPDAPENESRDSHHICAKNMLSGTGLSGTTLSGTWLSGNHSGWLPCHSALREEYGAPLSTAHICAGTGLAHMQGTHVGTHLHRRNSPSTGETRCVMAPGGMKASAAKWDRVKWDLAKWEPQRRCVMAPGGMKAFAAGHARPLSGVLRPSRPSGPSPCGRPAHA